MRRSRSVSEAQQQVPSHVGTWHPDPPARTRPSRMAGVLTALFLTGPAAEAAAQALEKFRASVHPSSGKVYTCRSNANPQCAFEQCAKAHPDAASSDWPCQKLNVADVGDGSYPFCAVGLYRLDPSAPEVFGMLSCAKTAVGAEAAARMWGGDNEKSLSSVRSFAAEAPTAVATAPKAATAVEAVATKPAQAPTEKAAKAKADAEAAPSVAKAEAAKPGPKAEAASVEAKAAAKAPGADAKAPGADAKTPGADAKPAPAKTDAAPASAAAKPASPAPAPAVADAKPAAAPAEAKAGVAKPKPRPLVTGSTASAKVPATGTVVSSANLDEWSHLLSPGMQWAVERGAELRVGPYRKILDPPPYRAATEKFSGQVELSADGTALLNHVAGQPFPSIDADDPWIANKLMFNFSAAIAIDDSDIRNFDCDTGQLGINGDAMRVERHFLIDHIRRLYFRERLVVDPKPEAPNRDAARFKEALYPLIEPFDLKGTGFTFTRYQDAARQDDTWLYLPQLRRVRRLSSAQRSDALFGQDTDADSYEGYQGNIAWMEWKLLGEKKILATMHAEHLPVKWGKPSGEFLHDDLWEPRDVWVVEGVSKLPQYAYSKRVIFLDKEVYRIPFSDIHDSNGELWKLWVNNYRFAKEPFPGAKYVQEWDYGYRPSIAMIDVQLEHGTSCALPSHRFPGEQGWYVNLGDREGTTEDFFELSAIIAAGR